MIYATVNMTIGDYSSTCDNKILLYRGDKNVEIRIVMKGNKFTVLDSTYAQMIIRRPSATSVFSEPAPIQNDTVVFVITEDMIDELKEIGEYTFQVRLYDDTMTARATLPPCNSALIIERPIAVEGEAAVNLAIVNDSAVMLADTTSVEEDIFTEDNKYNRTIWVDGDLITDARLNKIEDALYYINENGGNGGGGGATAPYISTELPETVMVGSDENFDLNLYFNSPNMGKGTLRVFINDADSMSVKIDQGDSTTVVPSNLFAKGTNRVVVYVLDRVGVMSNSLVFYIRYGSTEISSDFDPYSAYDYGATIRYYFTPTALDTSLSLTFYMSIDGQVQQGVNCTSDTRGYYTFPTNLSADSHYCEAYVVDSKGVKSNVLSFNLIILDADTLVVASDTKEVSVEEGEQVSLDYKVYMKYNTSFIANIYVDDALVNTGTCNADFNYYKTSSLTKGVHTVKLEVFDVTETHSDYITWTVAVSDSTYEMLQPVNAGAMFIGTAVNKTNTDERKQYFIGHDQEGNEVLGTLSNFAYNSESGWVNDELIISGNSHVEIPVQPLANNAKYGFTLDIEFTSKQIGVTDAEVLTLWNDETNCGVKITTEKLILQSSNGNKCDLYFTDNEKTHVMFVIDRQELKAKIYLNGVMCEAFHLNDYTVEGVAYLDDFTVNSNIILGGLNTNGYCKIRNLRVYQVALTTDEIMNNFISCEIDKAKQRELSEFQKGNDLPTLYVYCDFSGLGKDDKKPCKIVYNSTNEELYGKSFNLDHKQSQLQYQGTSSMAYPIKNYRLNLRDENGDKWYYTLPTAQPECRFTLKADFMSSGHWTNTGMAKFINDKLYNYNVNDEKSMNPFKWDHVQNGGKVNDFRETITGFPCRLILVNDGETPLNTGQNEPTPGNTKDMGIFNFNNDKDNVTTLGFNSDIFPNCASYEVTANSDTSAGAFMSFTPNVVMNSDNAGRSFLYLSTIKLNDGDNVTIVNTSSTAKRQVSLYHNPADDGDGIQNNGTGTWKSNHNINPGESLTFTISESVGNCVQLKYTGDIEAPFIINGISIYQQTNPEGDYTTILEVISSNFDELGYLKESFELRHPDEDDVAEDWGFMGVEEEITKIDWCNNSSRKATTFINANYFGDTIIIEDINITNDYIAFYQSGSDTKVIYKKDLPYTINITDTSTPFYFATYNMDWSYIKINGVDYYIEDEVAINTNKDPYTAKMFDNSLGLKALIDWVDNCTDEEFVADFEEHFHKDYTLRYFCLVTLIGAVDNLGKNMMLDTADNKIFFPRFYDIDTICSYDNSGQLKFDVDIEMEQGYWNTSSSRLWTRIRDLMHADIVTTYNNMRQNGVSYENMMYYIYDEQIAKIPQAYYNKDYDVKYAPFADSYIGMAHGDTYEHVKRWLKQRFAFVDTLFDYAPSYNNDILTIRVNTTEEITLHLETYTPVYQHLSWYNGQMDKKKIDGKTSITFSGKVQAATDQEVLIYGGSNIKKISGIQSGNPNRLILGSATKLIELDASNCPLLAEINMNKANLSPHEYLNKVNLSNCPLLEGNLRLNNSPLIQELDIRRTGITGMNLPSSIRNLQVLRLPNTMTELSLNDAGMLHTLEFDEGVALQSVSMTNCNALENVINFDLLQTPSITLNNSYNTAAELYFRDTTNLSLSNMSNLERVIFTPNNEYETFELINVANAPDYKVTTFNCPKLSTFMTTAPYRESYNNCGVKEYYTYSLSYEVKNGYYKDGVYTSVSEVYYHYEVNISKYKNMTHHIKAISTTKQYQTIRCTYFNNSTWISTQLIDNSVNVDEDIAIPNGCNKIIFVCDDIVLQEVKIPYEIKDYDDIQPNTTFTANSIDISSTQFTDVKLLCTTDTNTLKLPTTVKNFYCDSSFDLDTDYLEDGEYDVVHGELVEPYTTDYEGEAYKLEPITEDIPTITGNFNTVYPSISWGDHYTDKIYMEGTYSIADNSGCTWMKVFGFDETDTVIWQYGGSSTADKTGFNGVIPANVRYVRIGFIGSATTLTITYNKKYTPNLIPSSADGSLIFSMYAPSNAVAPASGTWDLHGLEFDNFHTFGMNNDVKPSEDSFMSVIDASNIVAFTGKAINNNSPMGDVYWDNGQSSNISITCLKLKAGDHIILTNTDRLTSLAYATDIGENASIIYTSGNTAVGQYGKFNLTTDAYIAITFSNTTEYIIIDGDYLFIKDLTILDGATLHTSGFFNAMDYTSPIVIDEVTINQKLGDISSITMPARYDDYNITIKNAYIKPTTHNTMLYPLLVNEDNPITGTLDYTDYAGKHLSWSFAYTDEEYVNIMQPKDELLNSYEYRYNAFYDTEYEFDNPYEIARYTSSASGVLPGFNTEFTYTYDEIDNGDGTYTTKIYADSLDNLPTSISFDQQYANDLRLLTVDKLQITSAITTMQNMFRNNRALTYINTDGWDISNVTDMNNVFLNCIKLTSLDVSGFNTSNVTVMGNTFTGCEQITSLDLSNFDTSNVTGMGAMFQNCKNLTSLDLSNFDTSNVTYMGGMFNGCSNLTSLDISGFDTSKVINMSYMFSACSNLTSLDVSGFDTSNVTNMSYMFSDCSKLKTITGLGDLDTSNVTNIDYMFTRVSALETWGLDKWDTSKIEGMGQTFRHSSICNNSGIENWKLPNLKGLYFTFANCTNLTHLDISGWVTENTNSISLDATFYNNNKIESINFENWSHIKITKLSSTFIGCSVLTEIKGIENFDTSNVAIMSNMFQNCANLTSLDVSGFDTSNVTNMENMFRGCPSLIEIKGIENWVTSKVANVSNMFNACSVTSLDLSNWDTSSLTNCSSMFYQSNIVSLDLSGWDTSKCDESKRYEMIVMCKQMMTLKLEGWATIDLTRQIKLWGDSVTGKVLYGTIVIDESTLPSGWVYNNALIIAKYTANAAGVLPGFNTDFTGYTTGETDNGDGTYTVSIATDSVDNLPTKINFTANNNLLTVDKLNTSKVTTMLQMFRSCGNLTAINCRLDTSSVTNEISQMFIGCTKLEYLDVTNLVGPNIKYASGLFSGCTLLKQIDGLNTWDTSNVTNMGSMFNACKNLTTLDVSGFDTSNVTDVGSMFRDCATLTDVNVTGLCTSKITDLSLVFYGCFKLVNIVGLNTWDTSNVTKLGEPGWQSAGIFQSCESIESLDLTSWNLTNVVSFESAFNFCKKLKTLKINFTGVAPTNFSKAFSNCNELSALEGIEAIDMSNVTILEYAFNSCKLLTSLNVSEWNTSNVTNMHGVFFNCSSLTSLNLSSWNTGKVTNMSQMFYGCNNLTSLDVSGFDTPNVTNMNGMFNSCTSLTTLDLSGFDTGKVTNMSQMFAGCKALTGLVGLSDWNTSALIDISFAFQSLPLTSLDLGGWDLTNCTNARDAWNFMYSLGSIVFPNNLSVSFGIGQSFNLTADNVVEIFNKLATVTTTQTASIGANLLNKLTEDQIAIATNKGWTVA